MIKEFNDEELRQDLEQAQKIYLYFYSPGCGPCKTTKPKVEAFGNSTDHLVYLVKSVEGKELQKQLKITAYPSMALIENKQFTQGGIGENEVLNIINGKSNQ